MNCTKIQSKSADVPFLEHGGRPALMNNKVFGYYISIINNNAHNHHCFPFRKHSTEKEKHKQFVPPMFPLNAMQS